LATWLGFFAQAVNTAPNRSCNTPSRLIVVDPSQIHARVDLGELHLEPLLQFAPHRQIKAALSAIKRQKITGNDFAIRVLKQITSGHAVFVALSNQRHSCRISPDLKVSVSSVMSLSTAASSESDMHALATQ
jgi:hypothetical protein